MITALKRSLFLLPLLFTFNASNAYAGFEVESPSVEKGEAEVEYNGFYEIDDENAQGHEVEIKLGITDWLRLGVGFELEKEDDEAQETGVEIGVLVVLMDGDKSGGFSLGFEFGFEVEREKEDGERENEKAIYVGPIVEFQLTDELTTTLNASYVRGFGDDNTEGLDYAGRVQYDMSDTLGLGVEFYGSKPDLSGDVEQFRIGPVLYMSLGEDDDDDDEAEKDDDDENEEEGPEVSASLGVLFGVTDDTPDTTIKVGLELEF